MGIYRTSLQASITCWCCWLQGSFVWFLLYGVWRCHADKWHHGSAVRVVKFPLMMINGVLYCPQIPYHTMAWPEGNCRLFSSVVNTLSFINSEQRVLTFTSEDYHLPVTWLPLLYPSQSDDSFALSDSVLCGVWKPLFYELWVASLLTNRMT